MNTQIGSYIIYKEMCGITSFQLKVNTYWNGIKYNDFKEN